MSDELTRLRRQAYQAAGEFHEMQGRYFSTLIRNPSLEIEVAQAVRTVGEKYRIALELLLAYLASAVPSAQYEVGRQRSQTLIEILDRELAWLSTGDT